MGDRRDPVVTALWCPGESKEHYCLTMIEEAKRDNGGLVLAPTQVIEPEVPWENILAFIETVVEHNRCKGNY